MERAHESFALYLPTRPASLMCWENMRPSAPVTLTAASLHLSPGHKRAQLDLASAERELDIAICLHGDDASAGKLGDEAAFPTN